MEVKKVVDKLYPIKKLLEIRNNTSNVKCPIHDDLKPSAHIYDNYIWCFTCKKRIYVSDLCILNNIDINKLYQELLDKYGRDKLEEFYNNIKYNVKKDKIEINKQNEDFISFTKRFFESEICHY